MRVFLSPKQAARAIGASEASLKRWCDQGLLPAVRTAGGHRRLPVSGVVQFLRKRGLPVVDPRVLGMPATTGTGEGTLGRAQERIADALEIGDGERFRAAAFDLYLSGQSVASMADRILTPAFEAMGKKWEHGSLEIYQERRAIEICTQWLYDIRAALPPLAENAPYAIGGTLSGDPYSLATMLVEIALTEAGSRTESHGIDHPVHTICSAIRAKRPRLVWISLSVIGDPAAFLENWQTVYDTACAEGALVAVGDRALAEDIRREMPYSVFCDTLGHLVSFLESIK